LQGKKDFWWTVGDYAEISVKKKDALGHTDTVNNKMKLAKKPPNVC